MRKLFLATCLLLAVKAIASGDPKYPVYEIPAELLENVDVVLREDHMLYTIHAQDRATLRLRQVVTIMNENGRRYASEVVGYDKLSKVTSFKGTSYDAAGQVVKKLKSSEIYDQSAFDGFSLYSDNRIKVAQLSHGVYPYTVEFEYEVEFKYLFMIPGFVIIPGEKVSVQNSSYQLIFPAALTPKYKVYNFEAPVKEESLKDGNISWSWKFQKLKPIKLEPMGPPIQELIPQIAVAPTHFEFDGYKGSTTSWDDFGKWIITLNNGRNELTEEAKSKVKELTANLNTPEEKIKAVYEYMQNRTRYVSVQLGIGGFQPFEASVVDKTGYGDCKALSNYMVSMLNVIGIKANYTLIQAGWGAPLLKEDFPSSQFNHAVVSVPNNGDTLWLECTSQTNPFGYMGTFTGNRKALAITDNGAKVVATPVYTETENIQSRTADVTVSADGNAKATVKTSHSGLQYERGGLDNILDNQFDNQKKWVQENTGIPSFDINSFKFENRKAKVPTAVVKLDLTLKRFASVSGKRLMLTPNLMNRNSFVPEKVEGRKTEIVRNYGYSDYDTIRYHIPEEIYPEFLPEPQKIKSRFGEYEASFKVDQGLLIYVRKIIVYRGTFPAASYQEFMDFHKSVSKADNIKLVFLNKT
jgi:hypothetical protein